MHPILITGAAGFIGSHTCDYALSIGLPVVGVDNFRTGRAENLAQSHKHALFRFVKLDLTENDSFKMLVQEVRPAAIIHLAALVSVQESITNPDANFRLNVQATHVVTEAARNSNVPRLVFASSAAVYGNDANLPLRESAHPQPISPYGGGKLASEALILSSATTFGYTAWCLRYFNVYGPRQDPHSPYSGVISIFCDKFKNGLSPTIFGDGEQSRDFISVRDVARANVLAAIRCDQRNGIVNICTGKLTTLNTLAKIFRVHIPHAPIPTYSPARTGDIRMSFGSPDKALSDLEFVAQIALSDGLDEVARKFGIT
jgi:UDP-glucose 4-epimerase